MRNEPTSTGRQLKRLFRLGTVGGMTDSQLLEQFVAGDDETAAHAFEAIVERHGPMVLRSRRRPISRPKAGRSRAGLARRNGQSKRRGKANQSMERSRQPPANLSQAMAGMVQESLFSGNDRRLRPRSGSDRRCIDSPDVGPFLVGCTRTEPAIFAAFVPSSKPPFDSPCNLRTSHTVHRAIYVRVALSHLGVAREHCDHLKRGATQPQPVDHAPFPIDRAHQSEAAPGLGQARWRRGGQRLARIPRAPERLVWLAKS